VAALVLDVQTRRHAVGDHAGMETPGGGPRDLPGKEPLDPAGAAQVQVVPDDLLEELPAPEGAIEDLGPAHLHLADGRSIGEARRVVRGGQGSGSRASQRVKNASMSAVFRWSQTACSAAGSAELRNPLSNVVKARRRCWSCRLAHSWPFRQSLIA